MAVNVSAEDAPAVPPPAAMALVAPPPSPMAARKIASGRSRSMGLGEFSSIQNLLRCSSMAGVQVSSVPPTPLPVTRCEVRAWAALDGLLARTMHHAIVGAALAAWMKHVRWQRQARREALFDAMGGQMRSAIRRCGWMEERSGKEVMAQALVVWRGEVDFRCLWRSQQRAIDQARRHCVVDATCSAARGTFRAWHKATSDLRAMDPLPQPLPTLLQGPATQFVQNPLEKLRKGVSETPARSISCPRICGNVSVFQRKASTQRLASSSIAAVIFPDSTENVAGSHDASCNSTFSGNLGEQPGALLPSDSSLAAAALAVADFNTRQDEIAGDGGIKNCNASPVRSRRLSQPNRLGDSPACNTGVGYGCGTSPSQFRLKWAEISVTDATHDGAAALPLPRGPERLFYDVSSYTGRAKYGGSPKPGRSTIYATSAFSYRDVKDNAARLRKSFGGHSPASTANATTAMASGRLNGSP